MERSGGMMCPVTEGERPHGSRQPTARRCGEWSGPAVDWARRSAMIASRLWENRKAKRERTRVAETTGDTTADHGRNSRLRCRSVSPLVSVERGVCREDLPEHKTSPPELTGSTAWCFEASETDGHGWRPGRGRGIWRWGKRTGTSSRACPAMFSVPLGRQC